MNQRQPNHLNLLFDMGEVFSLVSADSDITTFLDRTVHLVATHLKAHVCSIYLFEEAGNRLVLKATQGLNPGAVDTVWMKPGEGLVGQCFETLSIVREGNASKIQDLSTLTKPVKILSTPFCAFPSSGVRKKSASWWFNTRTWTTSPATMPRP